MALEKITTVRGCAVPVPGDDIDTDRIIPARFMKCVTFDGLGEYVFYDDRDHPLNEERFRGATILLAGNNFGCGSSREHAPQAIYRAGFRGIIAEGFAEIFFGNSTQLGMPCVTAEGPDLEKLRAAVDADPEMEVVIDLEKEEIRFGGEAIPGRIRAGARSVLLEGKWDPLQDLLDGAPKIDAVADRLAYIA
jgi:3-isopropylmalate/(R)-2-methylmalate dehydratase small subunit